MFLQDALESDPRLKFHTCFNSMEVTINAVLEHLLLQGADGDEVTRFDVWLHQAVLRAQKDYTLI